MFNYKCESCNEGTVKQQVRKNFTTRVQGFPFTVPEATTGVCDKCGAEYFSAPEVLRWERLYKRNLLEQQHLLEPQTIQALRERLGLSIGDFAVLVGCTRQTVYNWERRNRNAPQMRLADLLLKLISRSMDEGNIDVLDFLVAEARRQGIAVHINCPRTRPHTIRRRASELLPRENYSRAFTRKDEESIPKPFPALTDFTTRGAAVGR
jgi:putative zinc finger/helix-turn-helix YgiT family protein